MDLRQYPEKAGAVEWPQASVHGHFDHLIAVHPDRGPAWADNTDNTEAAITDAHQFSEGILSRKEFALTASPQHAHRGIWFVGRQKASDAHFEVPDIQHLPRRANQSHFAA